MYASFGLFDDLKCFFFWFEGEACEIMEMFETNNVRQTIMDLPEHLQEDTNIRSAIQSILIILSPL